ncbi:MAG: hypothetical protein AVDCRST_MAG20-323 [uncultured Acidimicrobiales bacterium]|uniref:Uncharacterized protein n=1 Tax=uncultured Acidimicrobiales bacterium TaxID=310071 RepID=A0A6J4H5Y6_9ACTN|nr:MAG: hypothetical protein AVDCRST_MAG20-323 [uncultured Acidimicrobiales bacterium]
MTSSERARGGSPGRDLGLALGRLEVVAQLEQREREAAGAVAHALHVGDACLGFDPTLVPCLEAARAA